MASLGQPLLFLVALGFGFGPIFQRAGQGNYIQFLAPGVIGMTILFTAIFSGIELIWDRQFGFLKEDIGSAGAANHDHDRPHAGRRDRSDDSRSDRGGDLLRSPVSASTNYRAAAAMAFVFMVLMAVMFTALGTAIASVLSDFQGFQLVMNFLVMPIFFLSGALFPLAGLPKVLNIIASIDPLSYGVDGLRSALVGIAHFGVTLDLVVLSLIAAALLGTGSYLFSRIQL